MNPLPDELLESLQALDTPTVCNALEVVCPSRRARGFTVEPFTCAQPDLPPVVGYARTARLRAMHKPTRPQDNDGYYTYIAEGGPLPSVVVVEDMDPIPGYGALWGEVNTTVHYGLGCMGTITNGSIRDLPDSHPRFQMLAGMVNPSHAWAHVVDWGGTVNVHGMGVAHGDLIHADRHGAVVVPVGEVKHIIEEAKKVIARERILIEAARQPGFDMQKMREAWKGMDEIH